MNICHLLRVVLTLLLGVFTSQAFAIRYAVTDLGDDTVPYDLNDAGQVVGFRNLTGPPNTQNFRWYEGNRAFVWSRATGLQELPVPLNDTDLGSVAIAINASGQVAGARYDSNGWGHTFLWTPGSGIQELGGLTSSRLLPDHGDQLVSITEPTDIGPTGRVVGWNTFISVCNWQWCPYAAVEWRPGQVASELVLPAGIDENGVLGVPVHSGAAGISDSGQIVVNASYRSDVDEKRMFLVNSDGSTAPLSFTGTATAISADGWVLGGRTDGHDGFPQAFIWKPSTGLINLHKPEWTTSLTRAINASERAVGYFTDVHGNPAAFVWSSEGGSADLGSLLDTNNEGWGLQYAVAINSDGQILVHGVTASNGKIHALLLTPIKASTTTLLSASTTSPRYGDSIVLTATVTGDNPTGSVTFQDGAATLNAAALASGTATLTTSSLAVGPHTITAAYGGDANNQGSTSNALTVTVGKADQAPLTVIANPSTIPSGRTSELSTTGGSGTGAVSYAATGSGGATCSIGGATLTATGSGSCAVTATKAADENYNAATSAALLIPVTGPAKVNSTTTLVSDINPSTYGQLVTFTAVVSGPGAAPPTGTVTFRVGATVLGTSAVSGGVATFATASLAIGQRSLRAAYSGDNLYNASTSPVYQQVVTQAESGISLSSSSNPSVYGQSVTLTATVTGANPTGRVTFRDGTTVLGTRTLSGGVATLRISSLTAGTHEIIASYAGNARNTASSATLSQIVEPAATSTSLTSNRNPSRVGRSVTFTAVVNYTGVSGTVTFRDGGVELATVPMSGRRATFATSSLGAGAHPITAIYNGNGNTLSSTSGTVNQVVQ